MTSDDGVAIAVAQFAPGDDREANIRSIRDMASKAAGRGARLIVFPEYSSFFTAELGRHTVDAAEALDGPFSRALAGIAASVDAFVVAGMVERVEGEERVFNTVLVASPAGVIVAKYRKLHLYDAFGLKESEWVAPGPIDDPELFDVDGLTVGLQTCYDLRFPEVTRLLVDAGADIVACPSEWVRGPLKEQHWRTLVTARALENTIYVAAADHAPPIGAGNSMIVDPMGVEVATIGEVSDIALGWAARQRIAQVRTVNPSLALRRFRVLSR